MLQPIWALALDEPIVSLGEYWHDDGYRRLWSSYVVLPAGATWRIYPSYVVLPVGATWRIWDVR
jgi:hypothetical protein